MIRIDSVAAVGAVVLLSAWTAGCGAGDEGGGGPGVPPPTTFGGDRPVELLVPEGYDDAKAHPLLILLHGFGASGTVQDLYFGLRGPALARDMLYAYPDGTVDAGGRRFWNAFEACCDFDGIGVDDSGYLRALIDEIRAAYHVDSKRIYLAGHSNGGFMSYRMACDHADVVAAIAGLAGAMPVDAASHCQPSEPVHVLHLHGDEDADVAYEGAVPEGYVGAAESVAFWALHDGCDGASAAGAPLDLDGELAGAETTVQRFDGCDPGGSAELWTIVGAGHIPGLSADFAPQLLDFLLEHPKP